jgi:hypothetical protein
MRLLTEHDVRVGEQIALLQAQRAHLRDKIDWYLSQLPATSPSLTAPPSQPG